MPVMPTYTCRLSWLPQTRGNIPDGRTSASARMRRPKSNPLGRNLRDHRHLTRIALIPCRAAGDDDLLEDSVGSIDEDLTRVLTSSQLLHSAQRRMLTSCAT